MGESALGGVLELARSGAETEGALRRAIECGQGWSAQILAAHFQQCDHRWIDQEGLLEAALASGNAECMQLLVEYGTDPDQFGSHGQRLLATALAARKPDVVERLLELGADPNFRLEQPPDWEFLSNFNTGGKTAFYLQKDRQLTPLMLAALMEEEESARHLLAHGASTNVYTSRYKRYPVSSPRSVTTFPSCR